MDKIIGNTPLIKLHNMIKNAEIYAKMESYNPLGSMKDRAAENIIREAIARGYVDKDTTIIESSSGNFGLALAAICKKYKLHFICVIDQNINVSIEKYLSAFQAEIVKITEPDANGGYLINRLKMVKQIVSQSDHIYWINQYENFLNAQSYYPLADEMLEIIPNPDYIFVPISSGGTITGISARLKRRNAHTKIIAVDSVGSVIFGGPSQKRNLPGLGSSIVPPILKNAFIDDVIIVQETEMIRECRQYLDYNGIMIGGSSGACLCAIKKYFNQKTVAPGTQIITIFADRGERYIDTVYSDGWCKSVMNMDYQEERSNVLCQS